MERGQGVEQRRHGAGGDHADLEPAPHKLVDVVDGVTDRAGGGQCGAGVCEGGLSGHGERRDARRAVEQRGAQIVLELSDLCADNDWLTCTRAAARVKLASSATATKYSS